MERGAGTIIMNNTICIYKIMYPDCIVRTIKIWRLRWIGHIKTMEEGHPTKHIFLQRPMGSRKRRRLRRRFKNKIEDDLRRQNIRNWNISRVF